jgi:hypothetical protein
MRTRIEGEMPRLLLEKGLQRFPAFERERPFPGEHLVEHDAEGVHVGPDVDAPGVVPLLRRHVAGRAHGCLDLGERPGQPVR